MKYLHAIMVVNGVELLRRAVQSAEPLWPDTFILDNSPRGLIGRSEAWPVPIVRPGTSLKYAQSLNFLHELALDRGFDVFSIQHHDAHFYDGQAPQYRNFVEETFERGERWAAITTHYDVISAYRVQAVTEIGPWDVDFPCSNYHIDTDWFYRATTNGYLIPASNIRVGHDHTSTLKADARRMFLHEKLIGMNDAYYFEKWGGLYGREKFRTPWNGALPEGS